VWTCCPKQPRLRSSRDTQRPTQRQDGAQVRRQTASMPPTHALPRVRVWPKLRHIDGLAWLAGPHCASSPACGYTPVGAYTSFIVTARCASILWALAGWLAGFVSSAGFERADVAFARRSEPLQRAQHGTGPRSTRKNAQIVAVPGSSLTKLRLARLRTSDASPLCLQIA
jgi:hypothetical protein